LRHPFRAGFIIQDWRTGLYNATEFGDKAPAILSLLAAIARQNRPNDPIDILVRILKVADDERIINSWKRSGVNRGSDWRKCMKQSQFM
jgi:hypothetical protein